MHRTDYIAGTNNRPVPLGTPHLPATMRAFSLVELSIVLVILGLLTGGILAGQSLIRSAELQNALATAQRYQQAIIAFRGKYDSLPGDMPDATSYWGKNATYCDDHAGTATTNGTCNGNGNGQVNTMGESYTGSTEETQLWHQLSLAGMIEGTFTGITVAGSYDFPKGRIAKSTYRARTFGDVTGTVTGSLTSSFALDYGNVLEIAAPLTPTEAWSIDAKQDDGLPAQGKAIGRGWENCTMAGTRNDLSATYNLTNSAKACSVIILRNAY